MNPILAALQAKHVYAGTVPAHVKARRRAKNKVARVSRRKNRPLVVIDPATARKRLEDNGWGEHEMTEILHQLGIEAP